MVKKTFKIGGISLAIIIGLFAFIIVPIFDNCIWANIKGRYCEAKNEITLYSYRIPIDKLESATIRIITDQKPECENIVIEIK
jgi:hypothetical protein